MNFAKSEPMKVQSARFNTKHSRAKSPESNGCDPTSTTLNFLLFKSSNHVGYGHQSALRLLRTIVGLGAPSMALGFWLVVDETCSSSMY